MPIEYAEGAERANIGVRPLGRGPIMSPVVLEEIRRQKLLVADMGALPPCNSNENALQHRIVAARHMPSLIPIFEEFGLAYQ